MATTVDTNIFELQVKDDDDLAAVLENWEKRLKDLAKEFTKFSTSLGWATDFLKTFQKTIKLGEFANFSQQMRAAQQSMTSLSKTAQENATRFSKLKGIVKNFVNDEMKLLRQNIKQAASNFVGFSSNIAGLGRVFKTAFSIGISAVTGFFSAVKKAFTGIISLAKKVGETIVEFVADSVREYQKFEDVLIVSRRTMNLTKEETDALGDSIRKWGLELEGITGDELVGIAGIAGTIGLNIKDGEENLREFVTAIAQIGIATDISMKKAAVAIPQILTVYKVTTEQMGQETANLGTIIDALGNSLNVTQSEILKISQSISGTTATIGISKEQMLVLAATIGTVEKRFGVAGTAMSDIFKRIIVDSAHWAETLGLDAQKLLTTIRDNPVAGLEMVLQRLVRLQETEPIDIFKQKLEELGLSGTRINEVMSKLVQTQGIFAQAGRVVADEMSLINDGIANNTTLVKEAEAASGTLTNEWKDFQEAVGEVRKVIGKPILDAIARILDKTITPKINEFVTWFRESEAVKKALDAVAEGVVKIFELEISPWIDMFLKWVTGSEDLDTLLGEKIPEGMEKIRKKIGEFNAKLEEMVSEIRQGSTVWEALTKQFPEIKRWEENLKNVWNTLKELWKIIEDVTKAVKTSGISWTDVFDGIAIAIDFVGMTTLDLLDLFDKLINPIDTLWDLFKRFGEWLGGIFLETLKKIGRFVADLAKKIIGVKDAEKEVEEQGTGNSTWTDMYEWLGKNNEAVGTLTGQINALNDAQKAVEEVGTKNSVWPDMALWIDKNIAGVNVLRGSFLEVITELNKIEKATGESMKKLRELATIKEGIRGLQDVAFGIGAAGFLNAEGLARTIQERERLGALQRQLERDILSSGGQNAPQGQGAQGQSAGAATNVSGLSRPTSTVTNNVFNINSRVIDRQAMDEFTREITNIQTQQAKLRV